LNRTAFPAAWPRCVLRSSSAPGSCLTRRQASAATPLAVRLRSIPGIGLLTATALAGFVGDLRRFPSARHFASYLGLTPKEFSSGSRRRLGSISKRGDIYLRTLLIHGARAVQRTCANKTDGRSRWLQALSRRQHKNVATVALANRNARVAWALLQDDKASYQAPQ